MFEYIIIKFMSKGVDYVMQVIGWAVDILEDLQDNNEAVIESLLEEVEAMEEESGAARVVVDSLLDVLDPEDDDEEEEYYFEVDDEGNDINVTLIPETTE